MCWVWWWCSYFCFGPKIAFFGKIWSKKSTLSFQDEVWCLGFFKYAKFDGKIHLFSVRLEISFLSSLLQKRTTNCFFKLKYVSKTNSKILISMFMFTFTVFDPKYTFWAKLGQRVKFVLLRWNLVSMLIRICEIWWWCLFFLL